MTSALLSGLIATSLAAALAAASRSLQLRPVPVRRRGRRPR
jgi:hypothetical protein